MTDHLNEGFFVRPSKKGVEDFEDLLSSSYNINIRKWFNSGWDIFKKNAGVSIAFAVVSVMFYLLTSYIPFAGMLIVCPLAAGFIIVSLMCFNSKTPGFNNFFGGFRHFLPLFVFTIVSTILIIIGLFLLVIPGLYLSIAYIFAPCLIVDKNIDFWPAMEISRKKVNQNFLGILFFSIVLMLINMIGCIPFLLGLFITVPLSTYMITAAYRDIFMESDVLEEKLEVTELQ